MWFTILWSWCSIVKLNIRELCNHKVCSTTLLSWRILVLCFVMWHVCVAKLGIFSNARSLPNRRTGLELVSLLLCSGLGPELGQSQPISLRSVLSTWQAWGKKKHIDGSTFQITELAKDQYYDSVCSQSTNLSQ